MKFSKSIKTYRVRNILLLIGSIIFFFLFVEIYFKLHYVFNPHWRDDPRSKYLITNNKFSHWHPENFIGRCSSILNEFDIIFKTNKFGMVDKNRDLFCDNKIRIALLGDSFVEALQVETEKRFSDILENNLNSKGYDVEALNFGVSWYSPSLEIALYKNLIKNFDIDIFVIFIHFTDCTDDVHFKQQIIRNHKGEIVAALANPTLNRINSKVGSFFRKFASARYFHRSMMKHKNQKLSGESLEETYSAWFKKDYSSKDRSAMEYTKNNISFLINEMKKRSRVLITAIPISQTVCIGNRSLDRFIQKQFSVQDAQNAKKFYKWITNIANQNSIQYIDLFTPFLKYKEKFQNANLYYNFDGHFTPEAHNLVASILKVELTKYIMLENKIISSL